MIFYLKWITSLPFVFVAKMFMVTQYIDLLFLRISESLFLIARSFACAVILCLVTECDFKQKFLRGCLMG